VFGHGGLGLGLPSASWRGQLLGPGLSGGEVHHQDPLPLEGRLVPRRCIWLNRSSSLLADEPCNTPGVTAAATIASTIPL
jgi:hypothetical protein